MTAAAGMLERSFELFIKDGKHLDAAETSISRMYALAVLGRYDEAIRIGEDARNVFLEHGVPKSAGKIEHNLGNIYQRLDRYADAERILKMAISRFSINEDAEKVIQIENSLALAYANQTKLDEAEKLYEQSLKKAKCFRLSVTQAEIESNLGYLSLFQGNYSRTLDYFERSRSRYVSLGLEHQAAIAEQEVGDVYLELNLFPEARTIFQRVIPVFGKLGMHSERARALAFLARTEIASGNYSRSHRLLSESKQIYKTENNLVGQSIVSTIESRLFLSEKNAFSAIEHARISGATFRTADAWPRAIAVSTIEAEALMLVGEYEEARRVIVSSTADAVRLDLPQSRLLCLLSLGSIEMSESNFGTAERIFLDAIKLIEEIRSPLPGEDFRTGFVVDKLSPYFALTQINLAKNTRQSVEDAFKFTERARSRSLLETLDAQNIVPEFAEPEINEMGLQRAALRRELNWLYAKRSKKLDSATVSQKSNNEAIRIREDELTEVTRRIASRSVNNTFLDAESLELTDFQGRIGQDNALLEYTCIDDHFYAFVVTEKDVVCVERLASRDEIATLLTQLDQQIEKCKRASDRYSEDASASVTRMVLEQLFIKLVKPLIKFVGVSDLIIVPFQNLNYVPFHALFDGIEFLIESREIRYAPSASIFFRRNRYADSSGNKAVFLGTSDKRAPQIEDELKSLADFVPNAGLFLNENATLENLRESVSSAESLHLACHGEFRADNPLFSSLYLFDGPLTVRDVYDLDLRRCRLAVLSACETGLSSVAQGEELLGLIRGFICAGVSNLIISMWQVDDEASSKMMKDFYRSIVDGMSPGVALANAQRKLMKDHPHPFYWAPFFLIGRSEN